MSTTNTERTAKGREMTPWFPAHIKPVRVGVYRTSAGGKTFQYWNGKHWGFFMQSVGDAYAFREHVSRLQFVQWRGLTCPPK